ncbi:cobalt ABC transporter ATP-binding protein, partial [Mesorhizobium sp. M00.F.Ca.ET.186.01.1.1]
SECEEALAQRELLESLHLGMPLIADVWEALPQEWRQNAGERIPCSLEELKKQLPDGRVFVR